MNRQDKFNYFVSLLPIRSVALSALLAATTITLATYEYYFFAGLIWVILGTLAYRNPWETYFVDLYNKYVEKEGVFATIMCLVFGMPDATDEQVWASLKISIISLLMIVGYYQFTDAKIPIPQAEIRTKTIDGKKRCTQHSDCEGVCVAEISKSNEMKLYYEEEKHAFEFTGKCSETLKGPRCIPNINDNGKADRIVCR